MNSNTLIALALVATAQVSNAWFWNALSNLGQALTPASYRNFGDESSESEKESDNDGASALNSETPKSQSFWGSPQISNTSNIDSENDTSNTTSDAYVSKESDDFSEINSNESTTAFEKETDPLNSVFQTDMRRDTTTELPPIDSGSGLHFSAIAQNPVKPDASCGHFVLGKGTYPVDTVLANISFKILAGREFQLKNAELSPLPENLFELSSEVYEGKYFDTLCKAPKTDGVEDICEVLMDEYPLSLGLFRYIRVKNANEMQSLEKLLRFLVNVYPKLLLNFKDVCPISLNDIRHMLWMYFVHSKATGGERHWFRQNWDGKPKKELTLIITIKDMRKHIQQQGHLPVPFTEHVLNELEKNKQP